MGGRGEISALLVAGGLGCRDVSEDRDLRGIRNGGGGGKAAPVGVAGPGHVEAASQGQFGIDAGGGGDHAPNVTVLKENERNGIRIRSRIVAVVLDSRCVVLQSHGISRK